VFKNSPSICYIFFAIDDETVTSINSYTSMMRIIKYLIKSLRENKKHGAKWLLKMFPNKNWSLGGLKMLIKKIDNTGIVWTVRGWPLPNTSNNSICIFNFFDQRFQSTKLHFLLGNILSNCFAPYFWFSRKHFIKYLFSVLNPITDV